MKQFKNNSKTYWIYLIIILFFSNSCKKELTDKVNEINVSTSTRLKLNQNEFDLIYRDLRKVSNQTVNIQAFQKLKKSTPNFISLIGSNLDDKISKTASKLEDLDKKNINHISKTSSNSTGKISYNEGVNVEQPMYDEVLEQMVDDQAFGTMLNEDGEIEVNNIIYKVTPFGTFYTSVGNEALLNSVFDIVYIQNDYTLRINDLTTPIALDQIDVTGTQYNDVVLLNDYVYFVDSFIETENVNLQPLDFPSDDQLYPFIFPPRTISPINIPQPDDSIPLERRQVNYLSAVPNDISSVETNPAYQNMVDYEIDYRNGIGSIIQTLFENSTRYNYFNDNYRISALMYNRNYAIVKTLGIKIKFQKKGWFWWNKTNAPEIRGGWDYIAYNSAVNVPKITLPNTEIPPSLGAPYLINPYDVPYYGAPMWGTTSGSGKRYNLYGWNMKRGSNEVFTIMFPGWLVPFQPDGYEVKSSLFKGLIKKGWNELKNILVKSAPPSGASITNNDPYNFKFPVYSLNGNGEVKYLSINDMENMPKSYTSNILRDDVLKNSKINTFVSPYEQVSYNEDKIDIPLDFSTVQIKISTNPSNIALSASQIAKSLITEELTTSFEVKTAMVFGAVKYNGQWKGIRLKVKMKD
ncbi:hypothetical protein [Pedobacter sp. SL55]|uniref:hypothetical protein n=1 Tax=Pedobacter sp. SL55 TaxID=2995161 RepID=UPI00226EEA49|nr:hypothetical protein [Pedobacter sp. SL55]WAC40452.1 hypothetical protein OVA16_18075 [Pedobacter sp. SL55]